MKFKLFNQVFYITFIFCLCECKSLPKYVTKCSIKVPEEFSACALENAKKAIPHLLTGDKEYDIPKLVPWEIPFLALSDGRSLNVTFTNTTMAGIDTIDLKSIVYDKVSRQMTIKFSFEFLELVGHYAVQGKILILPIAGEGRTVMNFKRPNWVINFNLEHFKKKNGKEVAKLENFTLDIVYEGITFNLDNLFNGDKNLGEHMNRFLNENWKEIGKELRDVIESPVASLAGRVVAGILNNVPIDSIFDDA